MPILLQGIRQRFRSQLALDGIDLHVRRGDRYGFIGHNGAGKTTALRIALGLLRPSAGRVWIDGHDAWRSPRVRSLVGGLIERPGFHDSLAGRKNLDLLAALQGIAGGARAAEVDRVLELVGLQEAAEKRVGHYSQGMRQRLGLAQALLGEPKYLLLDEPTNGLDPEGIHELRQLLIQLSEERGITILLSSHLLQEVADLCNRVGVLQKGKMLVESSTAELLAGDTGNYRLSTADDLAAGEVLTAAGMAVQTEPTGGLRLDLAGQDSSRAVEALVAAGCKLRSFSPVESSLEEIYLAHARGERSSSTEQAEVSASPPADLPRQWFPVLRVSVYEFYRLLRPGPVIALLSPALIAPLVIYKRYMDTQRDAAEIDGGTLFSTAGITAYEALARALQVSLPLLTLVLVGIASQSLAGQIRSGTLRNLLLRPFYRAEILIGKLAALCVISSLAYVALLASAALSAGMAFDYGDLVEILSTGGGSFPILSATEVEPELYPALRSPLLPLFAFVSIGFLITCLTRGSAAALSLALGAVILLDLGRVVAGDFGMEAALPGPYLPSPLARNSHIDFFAEFAAGVSNTPQYFAATEQWVPLLWMACCGALSLLILRRKYLP